MASFLWLVFAVLVVLWLVGFAVNWGAFVWLLLIGALVALVLNLASGTRSGRWY
jgi:flagellar biosynthesis component FlhA